MDDTDVCSMLISRGADVNIQNCGKTTALMASALIGNISVCMLLLSAGADINLLDMLNRSALMFAALNGHVNVCSLLVSRGADIKYQNPDGYTVRMFAHSGNHEDVVTLLDEFSGSPRTLKYCLLKTTPKTSIKALLCWNDYQKEIKCYL